MARKKVLHLLVDLMRKQLRAAKRPLRIWTSLTVVGDFMSSMADIWSGLEFRLCHGVHVYSLWSKRLFG